ncbi:BTAD domain-containing putative transcriptional regulator [Nonomuraea sp. NEAU-A123]|uniref:BTAD domain-containing putative transcriptional regulator n=1 Tax=Nonomuraea sp. NEAU-A123 TaxID=2839649 RepID=UPI001BE3DCE5|nr:BTAD domain-containing putative transcriptional regulator [Nonomuraea sp. NEAU-A123]MBT2230265.1 winged helix-turn-helix domain-containing protein [Nonomuraea sp. NEAU-A123]
MRFGVLGPLAVWTDQGEPVTIPGLKVRALLADLLVDEGRPVSSDRLVDDLWAGEPPGNSVGALQVRVSQLRRALEDAEPGGKNLVISRAPGYLLKAAEGTVDAARFAELLARAETAESPRTKAELLSDALALWRGPAFADFADEEYTRSAILRLEEQRLSALEQQAEARLELGEHGLLVGELGDLVDRHPLRERLRAVHMRALYRAGRQSEALVSYADLRERLAEELGLDPAPELVALHQAILGQDPALSSPAPRPATNLPASLSDLIGRDGALAEVRTLLEHSRLVTLTGSGGVGKTRLALETATRLADTYADGAWLVELAPLDRGTRSPDADERVVDRAERVRSGVDERVVAETVAAALDIREESDGTPLADRLAGALRSRQLLLVLDNCEHVIEQVAELAGRLLRTAPGLRVLATSREPLAVAGEVLWSVPPLDVPVGTDPGEVARADAVRLFVARAAASAPGFTLDAGNAGAVAQLCQRLDGIPLALELAATRVRALGVQGVVARLDDRFRLLASGQRGAPPRQQTLMAVIDWSWQLLTEPERAVLRRLAVHADGCTLEAAEETCAEDGLDVLDLLARLVDRSLVVVADGTAGMRYRLLESVAEYCLERLPEAGELDRVRQAHAAYYTALAVQAEPFLYGHSQREWLLRLDAEAANTRAALDTAAGAGDAAGALTLVNALAWYWVLRGRLAEGRRSLESALAIADGAAVEHDAVEGGAVEGGAVAVARARAGAWRAGFALKLGEDVDWRSALDRIEDSGGRARAEWFLGWAVPDMLTGQELVSSALATFRAMGDQWGIAAALSRRARDAFTQRDFVALERDGEESARLFRQLGDRWGVLQATEWLGGLAEMGGDAERARRLFADGLRMAEDLGLWPEVAGRTAWLGWMALGVGEYERAMELCGQALRIASGQGHREISIMSEMGLAYAERRGGHLDLAEQHLNHLLEGIPRGPGVEPALHLPDTLVELGYLTELRGDAATAKNLHLEALTAAQRIGDPRSATWAVEGLAAAVAAGGDHERAAQLLGLAAGVREHNQTPAAPSELAEITRVTGAAVEALGEAEFGAAYERGGRLKLDDAAGLA